MELIFRELAERRLEIVLADLLMHLALYLFMFAAMSLYVVAVLTDKTKIYQLIPVLMISILGFAAARGEFMIHRPGGHVRYVENELPESEIVIGKSGQPIQRWETWKAARKNTWLIVVIDFVGAAVLLFILFQAQHALWLRGQHKFVVTTTMLIVLAAAAIPKVVTMAPK